MANVYLQDSTLTAIGDAIRAKAGNTTQLLPSEMAAAITSLPSGGGGLKPVKAPSSYVDSSNMIATSSNGWSFASVSSTGVASAAAITLSGLGVTKENVCDKIFALTTTCKPLTFDYDRTKAAPGKRARMIIFPALAPFIEWEPRIKAAVPSSEIIIPMLMARITDSPAASVTINNTSQPILNNSFLTYTGNYNPCFATVDDTNIKFYYLLNSRARTQVFDVSNKVVDTGQIYSWRK